MPTPYLTFDGNCAEAFAFYAHALGGTIESTNTFGDSPMAAQVPEQFHGRMMHSTVRLRGSVLMGSDAGPWAPFEGTVRSCSLSLHYSDDAEARKDFAAMAEGGTITMPYDKTFWAKGFGMLKDRFGVNWMFNCE